MTADEYFDKIKAVQKRRVSLERAIKEEKNRIYDISGIDPSKEKVSGGRMSDTSDKLIRQRENLDVLYKKLSRVQSIIRNFEERLDGLLDDDGHKDFNTASILEDFFINNLTAEQYAAKANNIRRESAYRIRRKAINRFGEFYSKELGSMEDIC